MRDELGLLSQFLVVAEERSFTRAARRLSVSPSALSHAIRALEEQVGVRLLARTTRSVAPTDAGQQLLARLRPALNEIDEAVQRVSGLSEHPSGRLRLRVPRFSVRFVGAKLSQFLLACPDVRLDITADDGRGDLVEGGFDAGIQLGEFIQRDMIAVRISGDLRPAIVGSPVYFKTHRRPKTPRDLTEHRCIAYRHGQAGIYEWEFDKGHQSIVVAPNGPLILDDATLLLQAALDGVGLAYVTLDRVETHLADGSLVRVLEDWCPPFPGFFLYYPNRRQHSAALAALIDILRM